MKKQYLSIKLPNIAPLNLWTLSHIKFNKESTGKKTVHIMGFLFSWTRHMHETDNMTTILMESKHRFLTAL